MRNDQTNYANKLLAIGLAALSFILVIFVLEIILSSYFPVYLSGYIGAYQYDKELGFRLKDNINYLKTTDYQQEIHTNRLGTVNFQANFDEYKILVFALGDSYTQGTGLPADASYPFQLDLLLNMHNNRYVPKYAIVNLGLAAFGGEQNLLALKRYARKIGKPKIILYLGCGNDYDDDLLFRSGYSHKHMVDGSPYWGWYMKFFIWLTNETEIGKRLKILAGNFRRQKIISQSENIFAKDEKEKKKASVSELEAPVFHELVKISQEFGARLIISWTDKDDGSYQWMQDFAKNNKISFADWYPAVASARKSIPHLPLTNLHSAGHYRSWVNGQIAHAFAEEILVEP